MNTLLATDEMEREIDKIARRYLEFKLGHPRDNKEKVKEILFMTYVDYIFDTLNPVFRELINNDFFYQDYPGWWESKYSLQFYTELKNQAMSSFLMHFHVSC